jgi:hypothetical protein
VGAEDQAQELTPDRRLAVQGRAVLVGCQDPSAEDAHSRHHERHCLIGQK